jgi:hypothetical protein
MHTYESRIWVQRVLFEMLWGEGNRDIPTTVTWNGNVVTQIATALNCPMWACYLYSA